MRTIAEKNIQILPLHFSVISIKMCILFLFLRNDLATFERKEEEEEKKHTTINRMQRYITHRQQLLHHCRSRDFFMSPCFYYLFVLCERAFDGFNTIPVDV